MTEHPLDEPHRVESDWTDQHARMKKSLENLGIDPSDARPDDLEMNFLVEDADGAAGGVVTAKIRGLTNCPPPRSPEEIRAELDRRKREGLAKLRPDLRAKVEERMRESRKETRDE